jgi:hypothetical protein
MSGTQTIWYGTAGNNDDQIGTQAWAKTGTSRGSLAKDCERSGPGEQRARDNAFAARRES